ncbi:MAG: insulinase family protein, partial [Mangrovicoccus sp.]
GLYAAAYYRGTSLDDTLFTVMMSPNPDLSLAEAEAALDGAIASFFEDGIDEDRLASLKRQRKAAEIYRQDNIDGLARYYGEALTSGLTLADIEAWPEIVQAVTSDDIMAAARDVFDRKRAVTGWLSAPSSPDSSASQTQEVSQ